MDTLEPHVSPGSGPTPGPHQLWPSQMWILCRSVLLGRAVFHHCGVTLRNSWDLRAGCWGVQALGCGAGPQILGVEL